jgi:hypothetical protein
VAVTESESEKKAQVALAEIIGSNSDLVASDIGNSVTGIISKAASLSDIKIEPDAGDSAAELERARTGYFDALIDYKTTNDPAAKRVAQRNLAVQKSKYNELRRSEKLEPIK